MPTYKLIESEKMGQLIIQLKTLQAALSPLIDFLSAKGGSITLDNSSSQGLPQQPSIFEPRKAEKIGRGGTKLADLVFDNIGGGEFTVSQALAAIKDKGNWNPPRAVDSIRVALIKDARFDKIGRSFKKR